MSVRIIGGRVGGRRIRTLEGLQLRPTAAKVREAIFDMIGPRIKDAQVLDLFAGCGALGIEALSRGAGKVTFIEKELRALKIIQENLKIFEKRETLVIRGDVFKVLSTNLKETANIDLVLLDPPYRMDMVFKTLQGLRDYNITSPGALIYAEHESEMIYRNDIEGVNLAKVRKYGDTSVSVFKI